MIDLESLLEAEARGVETALEVRLPLDGPAGRLDQAMRYATLGGGKRLRPILCLWTHDRLGRPRDATAIDAACALEMVHVYSLVHDDLPAMDDDDLRRGRPSCHRAFDEATAILAGDALLTEAFGLLARAEDPVRASALAAELASAAGRHGMAGGQQLDLDATGGPPTDEGALVHLQSLKTGALLGAALAMGAVSGGARPERVAAARRAGRDLGLAFQCVDDVLDATADPAVLGKSVGKDARQRKLTAVGLWGVEGAKVRAERWSDQAIQSLAGAELLDDRIEALIGRLVHRRR